MSDLERALLTTPVLKFVVPGSPITQGSVQPNISKKGNLFTRHDNAEAVKAHREVTQWHLRQAMRSAKVKLLPKTVPVSIAADFYFKQPGRSDYSFPIGKDLDKLCRHLGDSLTGVLLADDAQVIEWRARKHYGEPRTEVTVWVEAA